jgi:hypothetical protein
MNKKKTILVKLKETVNNRKYGKWELTFFIILKSLFSMEFLAIQKKINFHITLIIFCSNKNYFVRKTLGLKVLRQSYLQL